MRGRYLDTGSARFSDLRHQKLRWQSTLQIDQVKLFSNRRIDALNPARRVHLCFPVAQFKPDDFRCIDKALADGCVKRIGIG